MDISAAISGRRSTREYTKQPLNEQTILRLIRAATLAPSAVNQQPWTFTVVQNQELLDEVSRGAKAHMVAMMSADLAGGARAEHFRSMLNDSFENPGKFSKNFALPGSGYQARATVHSDKSDC